ncbi:MAG TPA: HAMP domain-containing sensor histidine kinase [Paenibacillus sp.]|nr:HAMP domain-containing sensor histidine kinase [Paenibacillus sp.]
MQVTKRFYAMNALSMLGACIVAALTAVIFIAAYTRGIGSEANLNEMERLLEVRAGIAELKSDAAAMEFDALLEAPYRARLTERAKALGAILLVVRNRTALYASAPMSAIDVERSVTLTERAGEAEPIELSGKPYLFARTDYALPSGEEGVLLLLTPMNEKPDFYLLFGGVTVGVFILTFLLLNFWVSYRFARDVIEPVSRLKDAAARIREGDLNVSIAEEGDGEVRELCRSLELMRIKLKESVSMQRKYDDNRSFLVSSISHDLKTPVTSILGYVDGILDGVARTPEKTKAYLETARSKAMLVNAMIDDLLLYSKLDLNQLPYHLERTNLERYFEDCVSDHRYEFERAGMRLTLRSELEEAVFVRIDRERMQRVVQNIFDNAMKYMKKDEGEATVLLRATGASAIVEIRDNGQGIPEEDVPRIFERFYRADPSRKSAEGSGLGLAIARQIVEGQDGKIWARSGVGEGTRVMISLRRF